jgi:signal recognition particle GTPase
LAQKKRRRQIFNLSFRTRQINRRIKGAGRSGRTRNRRAFLQSDRENALFDQQQTRHDFREPQTIDEAFLDELEEMLISTDIGVATTLQILDAVRRGVSRQEINDLRAQKHYEKRAFRRFCIIRKSAAWPTKRNFDLDIKPYVLMVVGVNGVGKTTTIGKLAQRIKNEGNDVLICAADTFAPPLPTNWKSGRNAPACRSFSKNREPTRRRFCSTRSKRPKPQRRRFDR